MKTSQELLGIEGMGLVTSFGIGAEKAMMLEECQATTGVVSCCVRTGGDCSGVGWIGCNSLYITFFCRIVVDMILLGSFVIVNNKGDNSTW